uniref:TIP41-like protein n=1 Tax=Macrostomum lignano TaxID=282301 RepID=A0A1I8FR57_9PLAT
MGCERRHQPASVNAECLSFTGRLPAASAASTSCTGCGQLLPDEVLYVKSLPNDEAHVSLELAVFMNKDFCECSSTGWLPGAKEGRANFEQGHEDSRHWGRRAGKKYKAEIESKLEHGSRRGSHFLLKNLLDDDVFLLPSSDFKPQHRAARLLERRPHPEVLASPCWAARSFLGMAKLDRRHQNDYCELDAHWREGDFFAATYRPTPRVNEIGQVTARRTWQPLSLASLAASLIPQVAPYARMHRIRRVYLAAPPVQRQRWPGSCSRGQLLHSPVNRPLSVQRPHRLPLGALLDAAGRSRQGCEAKCTSGSELRESATTTS